jgi:dinuclear metal center YbgI/SA1388 family protein
MKVSEIVNCIESEFPKDLQESYDNSGLITGDSNDEVKGILLALDITEAVLEEASKKELNFIISHHPAVFQNLKRFTGNTTTERIVIYALQNKIALFSAHTNLDNHDKGLNERLAKAIGLNESAVLAPMENQLQKLVTFVPLNHADKVREAIFAAGSGHIGEYDMCSYNIEGTGTFRGSDLSKPFVGEKGMLHHEAEIRIETILPAFILEKVIHALIAAHPYEEPAYDVYALKNKWLQNGAGRIGFLKEQVNEQEFLEKVKGSLNTKILRHSALSGRMIKKVAVCGGSGSFLIHAAIASGADAFVSADFKYHQFFEGAEGMLLIDAGHFETEQFALQLFYDVLIKKIPNFAVHFSESAINPVNYY